jgi:hypothetical protein
VVVEDSESPAENLLGVVGFADIETDQRIGAFQLFAWNWVLTMTVKIGVLTV